MLVVAQRISSIMEADQIIVLNEGKVVGKGTHHQLLKECQIYHEIATSQLSEEELAIMHKKYSFKKSLKGLYHLLRPYKWQFYYCNPNDFCFQYFDGFSTNI